MTQTPMKQFLIILSALLIFSCGNPSSNATAVEDTLAIAEKNYTEKQDISTATKYIEELLAKMSSNSDDKKQIVSLSEKAYKIAKDNKIASKQRGFLFTLIKEDFKNPDTDQRMLELANQMQAIKRPGTANIIYKSLMDNFSQSEEALVAKSKIDPAVTNLQNYIINIGEEITKGEVDKFGINRNAALRYVDACEAYALVYPNAPDAPNQLYKAAEIAKTIQTYPKLLSIYDWVIEKYPNFDKTPTMYFLKGFVLENDLKNDVEAKKVYEEFIVKFPNHELRDDIDFLLEHLGKSDEEIRRIIEEKNAQKQQ